MYYLGHGVLQDHQQAVYWYRRAAEQDNSLAQLVLATMYIVGDGVSMDYKQAAYWCRKAYEGGDLDAEKLWNLKEFWKYE